MGNDSEKGLEQALNLYERLYSSSADAKGEEALLGALFSACGRNGPFSSISTLLENYVEKGAVVTPVRSKLHCTLVSSHRPEDLHSSFRCRTYLAPFWIAMGVRQDPK